MMMRLQRLGLVVASLALIAACEKDKDEAKVNAPKTSAVEPAATKTAPPADTRSATGEQSSDPLIARVEACWGALASWDKEKLRACYPASTVVTSVNGIPESTMRTPQEVIVQSGVFRNAFADFKADLFLVLVNGNQAVALGLLAGTHKGGSLGIPPTNKPMSLFYAEVIEFDEQQRYKRQRDYEDQATILHQLGVQESQIAPAKEEPWPDRIRVSAKNDATEKANLETFKTSFAARVKGDTAAATASYADDAVFRYMPEAQPYNGKAEIASATKADTSQHKGVVGKVRNAWAAGNWVVAETTVKGTLAKPLAGIKGTKGKSWEENALELMEFADGKVKRHLILANSLKFAVNVGLIDAESLGG